MSDAISLNTLESMPALIFAGGMESRQQNRDRQGAHGSIGVADSVKLSPEARAASVPANPSATDQNVAAKAIAIEGKARSEQAQQAGNGNLPPGMNPERPWPGPERAAAIYAAMRDSVLPQTALAPWGTGISLAV